MNRPQVINPKTGVIVNLFSKALEELLDEGYTVELLKYLPILETSPHIPLTGYPELDIEIMKHLDITDLKVMCKINQYTANLCSTQHFWIVKMRDNHLTLPRGF